MSIATRGLSTALVLALMAVAPAISFAEVSRDSIPTADGAQPPYKSSWEPTKDYTGDRRPVPPWLHLADRNLDNVPDDCSNGRGYVFRYGAPGHRSQTFVLRPPNPYLGPAICLYPRRLTPTTPIFISVEDRRKDIAIPEVGVVGDGLLLSSYEVTKIWSEPSRRVHLLLHPSPDWPTGVLEPFIVLGGDTLWAEVKVGHGR